MFDVAVHEVYTHAHDKLTSIEILRVLPQLDECLVRNMRSGYEHWLPVPHVLAFYILEGELVV